MISCFAKWKLQRQRIHIGQVPVASQPSDPSTDRVIACPVPTDQQLGLFPEIVEVCHTHLSAASTTGLAGDSASALRFGSFWLAQVNVRMNPALICNAGGRDQDGVAS